MQMTSELSVETQPRRERSKPKPWQFGTVTEVIVETPETNTLRIMVPDPTKFVPGQYYNIRIPVEGRERPIQRAYSVGSSPVPDPSVIDVGIREALGGLVSPILVRNLASGDQVEIRGPYGAFTWTEKDPGPLLLIGAGSGVVPLMSMIRYQVAIGTQHGMHLLFSSRTREYAIYASELLQLEAMHPWLNVSHTFTRDPHDSAARYHRRIDSDMVKEVYKETEPTLAYICGPPEVVEKVESVLLELGMAKDAVRTEKYD